MKWNGYFLSVGLFVVSISPNFGNTGEGKPATHVSKQSQAPRSPMVTKCVVNLDALEGSVVYPDLIIGEQEFASTQLQSDLFLAAPTACVVVGDSVYICDRLNNSIVVADKKGQIIRRVGRAGKGPGEFLEPYHIASNGEFFFIYDFGNARVQIFTTTFKYTYSIPAAFPMFGTTIAANRRLLLIHGSLDHPDLVKAYVPREPFTQVGSFFQRQTSVDRSSGGKTMVKFAVNGKGDICVGYFGSPNLYLYDSSFTYIAEIQFRGKPVDDYLKPLPKGLTSPGGNPTKQFINGLALLDDGSILLAVRSDIFIIAPTTKGFEVKKRLLLRFKDRTRNAAEENVPIWSIAVSGEQVYVCPKMLPMVFRFSL